MMARTSRMWTHAPIVDPDTRPRTQSTSRITVMVQSMPYLLYREGRSRTVGRRAYRRAGHPSRRTARSPPGAQRRPCAAHGRAWHGTYAVLRKSLRTSMLEGALAEVVGACTSGGALTAWALYLELPPLLIGVLGALPFTAQLVQLPAAWCTRRFGSRRAALWTIGISRQCVLPLACLPFVPLPVA